MERTGTRWVVIRAGGRGCEIRADVQYCEKVPYRIIRYVVSVVGHDDVLCDGEPDESDGLIR